MQTTTMITACSTLAQALEDLIPIHSGLERAYDNSITAALSVDDASTEGSGLAGAEQEFQHAAELESTAYLNFTHHARKIRAAMRQVGELLDRVEAVYEPGDRTLREEIGAGFAGPSQSAKPKKQGASPADESPPAA